VQEKRKKRKKQNKQEETMVKKWKEREDDWVEKRDHERERRKMVAKMLHGG
jgi:hypothetical protein